MLNQTWKIFDFKVSETYFIDCVLFFKSILKRNNAKKHLKISSQLAAHVAKYSPPTTRPQTTSKNGVVYTDS